MASKKKWKERAQAQERLANDLFSQLQARAGELQRIDQLLHDAEFPGPTIDAWCAQMQQFLNRLVEERGIVKKSYSGGPYDTKTVPSSSGPSSRPPTGTVLSKTPMMDQTPDGEYKFLEPTDLTASTQVPAGPDRFA